MIKTIRVTVMTTVCPQVAMDTRSNSSIQSLFRFGRLRGSGFERLDRPKENLLNQAGRVNLLQESAVAVVLDQRGGLLLVRLNSFPHDILAVVGANHEGRPALVADAGLLRRIHEDVIDGVVLRAHPSPRVPLNQFLRLQEQVHGRVEVRELRKRLGLGDRPREAVEDESLFRIFLFQAAFCHRDDEFVRHEFSGVHVCLRLLPEFGALGHTVTEDVPRGDPWNAQVCGALRGLGALAGSGRPKEDEAHEGQRTDSAVKRLATPRVALSDNEEETRTSIEKGRLHRPQPEGVRVRIGIIGAGHIGGTAATLFARAGHEVAVSNSRGPDSLAPLVTSIGRSAHADSPEGAAKFGDPISLAIPWRRMDGLPPREVVSGQIVSEPTNAS